MTKQNSIIEMKSMNLKSSDELIARVESSLKSFKAAGLLDSGDFYRWIKEILMKLNIPAFNRVHTILEVNNYKATSPNDMQTIIDLYRYDSYDSSSRYNTYEQPAFVSTYFKLNDVEDDCCKEEDCICQTSDYKLLHRRTFLNVPKEEYYCNAREIYLTNYKQIGCDVNSPSRKLAKDQATYSNSTFHLNFDSGYIYVRYNSFELDEDGLPMIPDVVQIEDVIEKYIIYKFLLEQYYNNNFDAIQRFQLAKQLYDEAYGVALRYVKLPTFKSVMRIAEKQKRKFRYLPNIR